MLSLAKSSVCFSFATFLLVLLSGSLLTGCSEVPEKKILPRPVFALKLADTSALSEGEFPGRARASSEVNRSFRVSGPLISFPVKIGDAVAEGDVLARIDPQDFENSLATLKGQLDRAKADEVRAEADFKRIQNVFTADPGATSEASVDRARQLRDSSAANVRSLQASVKNASDQLSYTYLRAPFNGVIVETYVENFETVIAGQPIFRMLDPGQIEFVIYVPESMISLAPFVKEANVTFDAFPGRPVPAFVSEVGTEASQATRTYPVTLLMDQPEDIDILPGMAGRASVAAQLPENDPNAGMSIPATAVFPGNSASENFVWVIDSEKNTIQRREVELGHLSEFGVHILAGLRAGDWIVTKGVNSLEDGQSVQIINE